MKRFILSCCVYLSIDLLWLGVIAASFYRTYLGPLMRPQLDIGAAIAVYLLIATGLNLFVLSGTQPLMERVRRGIIYGLCCYGTYDLTNQATLRDWPFIVTLVDMLWGAIVMGLTTYLTLQIERLIPLSRHHGSP